MTFPGKSGVNATMAEMPDDWVQIVVQIVTSFSQADSVRQTYYEFHCQGLSRRDLLANQRHNVVQELTESDL